MAAAITAASSALSSRAGMTETDTGGACKALRLRYGKSARTKPMTEMARKLRKKSMTLSRTAPCTESGINATWGVIAVHVYRAASSYGPRYPLARQDNRRSLGDMARGGA